MTQNKIFLLHFTLIRFHFFNRTEPIQTLSECKDSVTSVDVSDYEILVGSADGKIRRYDLR